MKKILGVFVVAVVGLFGGGLALVTFISSDPGTLCEQSLFMEQLQRPALPDARDWDDEQTATADAIIEALPDADPELLAIAIAMAIQSTDLAPSTDNTTINPLTGVEYTGTLAEAITAALEPVTSESTWRSQPAGEVVAMALGRPGDNDADAWTQAALLVADVTNTDAEFLLEQANTDVNCAAAQMAMPNVVTIDGISYPVPGYTHISSRFGWRMHPIFHVPRLHAGVDFPADCGSGIVPVKPGLVVRVDESAPGLGTLIEILHEDGTSTIYGHMYPGTIYVREGQQVYEGQRIADVGSAGDSTACHLHVELHSPSGAALDIGRIFNWY